MAKQNNFESHKRLMLLASLNLLIPAMLRLLFVFNLSELNAFVIANILMWIVWIIVPIIYDRSTIGKAHKSTKAGIGVLHSTLGRHAARVVRCAVLYEVLQENYKK